MMNGRLFHWQCDRIKFSQRFPRHRISLVGGRHLPRRQWRRLQGGAGRTRFLRHGVLRGGADLYQSLDVPALQPKYWC